jgi:hypothetical protein
MSNSSKNYSVAKKERRQKNVGACKFVPNSGNMHINKVMSSKIWRTAFSTDVGKLRHIVIRH